MSFQFLVGHIEGDEEVSGMMSVASFRALEAFLTFVSTNLLIVARMS